MGILKEISDIIDLELRLRARSFEQKWSILRFEEQEADEEIRAAELGYQYWGAETKR